MTYLCGYQKADNHQSKRSKLFHLNFICNLWKQFILPPFLMVLFFKHQISRKWNQPALRVKIGVFDIAFILGQRGALSSNPTTLSIFQGGKEFCCLFHEFFCVLRPSQAFFKSHNSQVNKRDLPKYCSTTHPRDYFRFQLKDVSQGWTPRPAVNLPRGEGGFTVGKGGSPPRPEKLTKPRGSCGAK